MLEATETPKTVPVAVTHEVTVLRLATGGLMINGKSVDNKAAMLAEVGKALGFVAQTRQRKAK